MLVSVVAAEDEIRRQTFLMFTIQFIFFTTHTEIFAAISLKQMKIDLPLILLHVLLGNLRLVAEQPLRHACLNRHFRKQFESEFFFLPLNCLPLPSLDVLHER